MLPTLVIVHLNCCIIIVYRRTCAKRRRMVSKGPTTSSANTAASQLLAPPAPPSGSSSISNIADASLQPPSTGNGIHINDCQPATIHHNQQQHLEVPAIIITNGSSTVVTCDGVVGFASSLTNGTGLNNRDCCCLSNGASHHYSE